jgi:hypothetical protein
MALPRSPLHTADEVTETKDAGDVVDSSLLPPG